MICLTMLFLLSSLPHLEEKIPPTSFAYVGRSPREEITYDPENSPLVEQAYQTLKEGLSGKFSEKEILISVQNYVGQTLFQVEKCTEEQTATLIQAISNPQIPLDAFIKEQTGVCRHLALCTTLFLDRLVKEGWLEGEVFLIRDMTPSGRHAWTLFLSEKAAWHLDPFWGVLANGKVENEFNRLCHLYGKQTMETQKKRWESGD